MQWSLEGSHWGASHKYLQHMTHLRLVFIAHASSNTEDLPAHLHNIAWVFTSGTQSIDVYGGSGQTLGLWSHYKAMYTSLKNDFTHLRYKVPAHIKPHSLMSDDPTSTMCSHNMSCDLSNKILFNPYKPSVLFVVHGQTVQTQIRRCIMRRLIRVSTVC